MVHSIVIPVFNEVQGLPALILRLNVLRAKLAPEVLEFILVNDGSTDGSTEALDQIAAGDPTYKVIHLSRNFGHQLAITAGLQWSRGATATVIDGDLQDPPEVILEFISKWKAGFEVVYGVRRTRPGETHFKLFTAKLFYRILRKLTNLEIPVDTGDFRLMDRKVVDAFLQLREQHRFVRGLVSWVGFKQTGVQYDRAERRYGETHYPFGKMLRLALDGITSFSTVPLKIATYVGLFAAFCAMGIAVWAVYVRLFTDHAIQGWTSVMLAVLFLGGAQLVTLGFIGEYLGRTYNEVKNRPLFFVARAVGFERESSSVSSTPPSLL